MGLKASIMMSSEPVLEHTQRAPLCLLVYALAITLFGLAWVLRSEPLIPWMFPIVGLVVLVISGSFHHLTATIKATGWQFTSALSRCFAELCSTTTS